MIRAAFEELVADALDEIPEELWARLDNVVFIVEDERLHESHSRDL